MAWILTSVIFYAYSKLYILTELRANDVTFTSVDRQKLDLSKYIYLWYRKCYISRDTAQFYEHKKMTLVYVCLSILSKCQSVTTLRSPLLKEVYY